MYCTRKVLDDLIWVGADDRRLVCFEGAYDVPNGVSYNSYLLTDEKTVLFDTVDKAVFAQFFENIDHALGGRGLDYIVVSHMEPDHAATLELLLQRHPETRVICNDKIRTMIAQFFRGDDFSTRMDIVKEGDTFKAGRHELTFVMAPMVHWPEVMMTYDLTDKILFSADAFGTFGALNGKLFADECDFMAEFLDEARRYYTNIVGKYGVQVQAVLKKAAALDIQMICPLHGPIWRENLGTLLEKYQKWSTYEPEDKTVMIAYATMYGNTENAVNVLANMLADKGVKNIAMYDVSETDVSELVAESFRCSHIVLAAPTYNGGVQPKMEAYLSDIKALALQNRTVAIIDNGTWAPTAGKQMRAVIDTMKNMTVLENPITLKSALAKNQLASLDVLAEELASQVNA